MKKIALYIMAVLYILAGINHFVNSSAYVAIVPVWLPRHAMLVYASGVAEIVLGILLMPRATRTLAAWGIIALLVVVFPANVQMMQDYIAMQNPYVLLTILRLPLQLVLIWWAWLYTRKPASKRYT